MLYTIVLAACICPFCGMFLHSRRDLSCLYKRSHWFFEIEFVLWIKFVEGPFCPQLWLLMVAIAIEYIKSQSTCSSIRQHVIAVYEWRNIKILLSLVFCHMALKYGKEQGIMYYSLPWKLDFEWKEKSNHGMVVCSKDDEWVASNLPRSCGPFSVMNYRRIKYRISCCRWENWI